MSDVTLNVWEILLKQNWLYLPQKVKIILYKLILIKSYFKCLKSF